MVRLSTDRLLLREFVSDDWRAVHEYASDADVVRYLAWGPNAEQQTRAFVDRAIAQQGDEPRRDFMLAVALKDGGRLIGGAGLHVSRPAHRTAYVGYCLNPRFWGSSYATEAVRALVAFGFGEQGLHRIFATCDTDNGASARVLEKSGFLREGHMREHRMQKGRWRDSFIYAILEDGWHVAGR